MKHIKDKALMTETQIRTSNITFYLLKALNIKEFYIQKLEVRLYLTCQSRLMYDCPKPFKRHRDKPL